MRNISGDGFRSLQVRKPAVVVLEAVAYAVPNQFVDGHRLIKPQTFLPLRRTLHDRQGFLDSSNHMIFGVQDFQCQAARSRMIRAIRNHQVQSTSGIAGGAGRSVSTHER